MTAPVYRSISIINWVEQTDIDPPEPAGAAENDILLYFIISAGAPFASWTPPAGWTELKKLDGSTGEFYLYWIRRGASAPALRGVWDSLNWHAGYIAAYPGAATTASPFGATNLPASISGGATSLDPGGVTTTANDSTILAGGANFGDPATAWAAPSGYTLRGPSTDTFTLASKALTGGTGTSQDPGSFGASAAANEAWTFTLELLSENPSGGGAASLLTPSGGFSHMLVR
jgi:hypothetical protein